MRGYVVHELKVIINKKVETPDFYLSYPIEGSFLVVDEYICFA